MTWSPHRGVRHQLNEFAIAPLDGAWRDNYARVSQIHEP